MGERETRPIKPYEKDAAKWVTLPAYARGRRADLDRRQDALAAWAEFCDYNAAEMRDARMGVITAGACYQYVRDALPEASVLKLGITWPLPSDLIRDFARKVDLLYVVEEASTYLSTQVKATGVVVSEPPAAPLPRAGELSPARIAASFGLGLPQS